ncbi:hypothetical protein PU560_15235, partial [Georgenia sp. 10Sc9-8]|nr:hypothetical protein [Georgenia halotolerans]
MAKKPHDMSWRRGLTAVVAGTVLVAAPTTTATAKGDVTERWGVDFYLSNTFSSEADTVYKYGGIVDYIYVGDWDGDGQDTLAYRAPLSNVLHARNSHTTGAHDQSFAYGFPGERLLVG